MFLRDIELIKSFSEGYLVDLPFFSGKSSLYMPSKSLTRLWIPGILEVVVADRKLGIRLLNIRCIYYANITTSKNGTFVWVTSDSELCQIEVEFLSKID